MLLSIMTLQNIIQYNLVSLDLVLPNTLSILNLI